jgi:hypothetical protein
MASMNMNEGVVERKRRKFILCFDGTGNKFQGTAGDSNSEIHLFFFKKFSSRGEARLMIL